jgi:hypothetical protein
MSGTLFGLADSRAGVMVRGVAVPTTLVVICATSALLVAEMLAASLLNRSGCCERHWLSVGFDPRSIYSSSAGSAPSRITSHFLKIQFALHTPRRRSLVEPTRNALRAILSRLLS